MKFGGDIILHNYCQRLSHRFCCLLSRAVLLGKFTIGVLATTDHVCAPQITARQRIHLAGGLNLVHIKLYIRRKYLNKKEESTRSPCTRGIMGKLKIRVLVQPPDYDVG